MKVQNNTLRLLFTATVALSCVSAAHGQPAGTHSAATNLQFEGVIRQQHDFSCGAAALATLLKYHLGIETTEKEVLDSIHSSLNEAQRQSVKTNGLSATYLLDEVTRRKLTGKSLVVQARRLRELQPAAIARLRRNELYHFVVFDGLSEDGAFALIRDPDVGRHKEPIQKFLEAWLDPELNEQFPRIGSEPHGLLLEIIGTSDDKQLTEADRSRSPEIVSRLLTYEKALLQRQTELTPTGSFIADFALARNTGTNPIDLGGVPMGHSRGQTTTGNVGLRYGVNDRNEVALSVGGVRAQITSYSIAGTSESDSRWKWGQLVAGLRSILYRDTAKLTGGINLQSPLQGGPSTGGLSLTADTTTGTITVYGSVIYNYRFGNQASNLGTNFPRSGYALTLGISAPVVEGVAVNPSFTRSTPISNGSVLLGSYVHPSNTIDLNLIWAVSKNRSLMGGFTHTRSAGMDNAVNVSYSYAF